MLGRLKLVPAIKTPAATAPIVRAAVLPRWHARLAALCSF